jgi:hypothetical protein
MVTKEMIEAVVREVLHRILSKPLLLMVFTSLGEEKIYIPSFTSFLKEVKDSYRLSALLYGEGCGRFVGNILQEFGVELLKETEESIIADTLNEAEALVAPTLNLDTLARMTLGLLDQPVVRIMFEALYEGKKVVVCTDTISCKPKTPEGLSRLIKHYLTRVSELGYIVVPLQQVAQTIAVKDNGSVSRVRNQTSLTSGEVFFSDRILTAEGIKKLPGETKRLVLADGVLVTPLAWDQLKASGIEVVLSKERGA